MWFTGKAVGIGFQAETTLETSEDDVEPATEPELSHLSLPGVSLQWIRRYLILTRFECSLATRPVHWRSGVV